VTQPPVIDLHTHILPQRWPDWTQRSGYAGWIELAHDKPGCACMRRSERDGSRTSFRDVDANCWDPAVRVTEMRATGVSMQVLSTVPVMFSYWAKPHDAYDLARLLNDHIADVCREHPAHFAGLATIPLQDPSLAMRELDRCVQDLKLPGVQIGTNVNGVNLDDPAIIDVLAHAEKLGACIFIHPWEMLSLSRHPSVNADARTSERMARYWMPWLVGMPAETSVAICSLLFAGVFERFASLRVCFAHGGGSFPATVGRIAHGRHCRSDLFPRDAPDPLHSFARPDAPAKFYVDSLVHEPHALRLLIQLFGSSRIALGSDYPFPLGEETPGSLIRSLANELTPQDVSNMLHGTARAFLGL
jgi:aminocarboxymuconate-semialdehyde decarboxylase